MDFRRFPPAAPVIAKAAPSGSGVRLNAVTEKTYLPRPKSTISDSSPKRGAIGLPLDFTGVKIITDNSLFIIMVSWVFPRRRRYNIPKHTKEDTPMQCQKLKTYMETGRVIFVPARSIHPNPEQPRKIFKEKALLDLSDSIRQHGILQPLSVRRVGNFYELIAGERRLRAAQMAGLTEIPCIVMTMDQQQSGMAAMVENLQRQDLDYIEEARGMAQLMNKWGISQEQTASLLGRSQSSVANKLRLLKHSDEVLNALRQAELTERHARALLKIPTEPQKLEAISVMVCQDMNVAKAEQYIQSLLRNQPPRPRRPSVEHYIHGLTRDLARLQRSGISAISERRETENEIVLTIVFPK